jgi:hypothetical protein
MKKVLLNRPFALSGGFTLVFPALYLLFLHGLIMDFGFSSF